MHRLDGYEVEKPEIFERTIEFTEGKMMPMWFATRSQASPTSTLKTGCSFDDPTALAMLIDVFSERPSM